MILRRSPPQQDRGANGDARLRAALDALCRAWDDGRERRARAAQIARQARYVELSTRSDFQKTFLQHIGFGS